MTRNDTTTNTATTTNAATNTTGRYAFVVHFGEGIYGRFMGFHSRLRARQFANAYLRGNSQDAFAWIYEVEYRADGRVFLLDNIGEIAREIPADLLK